MRRGCLSPRLFFDDLAMTDCQCGSGRHPVVLFQLFTSSFTNACLTRRVLRGCTLCEITAPPSCGACRRVSCTTRRRTRPPCAAASGPARMGALLLAVLRGAGDVVPQVRRFGTALDARLVWLVGPLMHRSCRDALVSDERVNSCPDVPDEEFDISVMR